MGKTKILIRAFTCRRDVPSALVLKKCLEFFGYEVIVSSIRDFERNLKLWKPSIAISNILNTGYSVKKINSKIKTVFFDGEGFQTEESAHYLIFKKHPELLKNIDMIFLWGDKVANELKEAFPKYKNIYVVGWPNLDLIRYNCHSSPKKTIGFVMRSPAINDHQGVPTIRTISNKGNLERIIHQCEAFVSSFDCIKEVLEKTNYNVSIRPHPLEQIESYMKYKKFWFKQYASRVFIDDTLCFSEWLRSQRLIISPTSTSLLEAYLLKVPVINIDYLAGNAKYNRDYAVTTAEWQRSAYLPKTMKEFIQLIKYNKCKVTKNEVIEKQLKIYCNWHIPGSYNLRAAKLIKENLTFKNLGFLSSLPTWIIKLIDEYSFWKACKVNPLHPNLNYKENFHKPIKQLDQTFLNIIKDDIKTP